MKKQPFQKLVNELWTMKQSTGYTTIVDFCTTTQYFNDYEGVGKQYKKKAWLATEGGVKPSI